MLDSLRAVAKRVAPSELGLRLARGAFWSFCGASISRSLGLMTSIAVGRILGRTGFGEFGMIQSTVGMFGALAGFGLGLTATRYVAESRVSAPERAGRIMALATLVAWITGAFMAGTLVFLAPWLSTRALSSPHLAGPLRVSAGLVLLGALTGVQTGALSGFEAYRRIAWVNLWAGLTTFPLAVGGVLLGGLNGAVGGLVASLAVNWLLNHKALHNETRRAGVSFRFAECRREWKILWSFGLPAVLGGIAVVPVNWACCALLVNQADGYGEMGIYNAALRIKQLPEMVLGMLLAPLLPVLSEKFGAKDTTSYNRTVSLAMALSLGVIVPVSLIQTALPALTLWPYGSQYQGHEGTVQWLMLHSVQLGLFLPISSILVSMNRMWFGFGFNLIWGLLYWLLSYRWVPAYGAAGLAAALATTHLATSLPCIAYMYRCEKEFLCRTPMAALIAVILSIFAICTAAAHLAPVPVTVGVVTLSIAVVGLIVAHLLRGNRVARLPLVQP